MFLRLGASNGIGSAATFFLWGLTRMLIHNWRTMQYRHTKPFRQRHNLEPTFLEYGSQYILPGPTVAIFPFKLASPHLTIRPSVGVGFSYADYGETVETTEDAAKNIHAFISIFFETFPQFSGRPLHLSSESYGVYLLSKSTECWIWGFL